LTFALVNDSAYTHGMPYSVLHCPVCGFGYNHESPPYVESGDDAYKARWGGRGNLTAIPFHCENGHHFEVCFGFHKGNVLAFVRSLNVIPERITPE
jgi:hypothetical protein